MDDDPPTQLPRLIVPHGGPVETEDEEKAQAREDQREGSLSMLKGLAGTVIGGVHAIWRETAREKQDDQHWLPDAAQPAITHVQDYRHPLVFRVEARGASRPARSNGGMPRVCRAA